MSGRLWCLVERVGWGEAAEWRCNGRRGWRQWQQVRQWRNLVTERGRRILKVRGIGLVEKSRCF